MSQQNKADCIPGRYFPCLADYANDIVLELEDYEYDLPHICARCELAMGLEAMMGEKVHFIIDTDGATFYICPHKVGRDGQTPLWNAQYVDSRVYYRLRGCLPDHFKKQFNALCSAIENIAGIPQKKRTGHYEVDGYYSFEREAFVFKLNSSTVRSLPKHIKE